MQTYRLAFGGVITCIMVILLFVAPCLADVDTSAPASPVKLVFIHHSTGGNWLADANADQPYGGLAAALMANNYYVSATNYGWGPDSIGDRTDIVNWPEWFTGPNAATITTALFAQTGQSIEGYGDWARLAIEPDGENEIVMLKSCFPNSDLFGSPTDQADAVPNDQYTVRNAKAVYNNILTYFQSHPDKLFIVVTAPPMMENEYNYDDYQTVTQRAANARAFNNWLVTEWLASYPYANVGVFDYFNVLTGPDNHHRVIAGAVEHVTSGTSNFAYYPSGDSHPNTTGQQKATTDFVPLLNHYYHLWQSGAGGSDDTSDPGDSGDSGGDGGDTDTDDTVGTDGTEGDSTDGDGGGSSSGCFIRSLR